MSKEIKYASCEYTDDLEYQREEKARFAKALVDSVYEIIKKLYSLEKEFRAILPEDDFEITFLGKAGINVYDLINQNKIDDDQYKEQVIKKSLRTNLIKSYNSISDKFDRRKEWTPNVIPDLIRFSVICKKSVEELGGMEVINMKIKTLTNLLETHGFKMHEVSVRLLPTGYADIQIKYETPEITLDGIEIKTLLEMQVHSEKGLEAKEEETPVFNTRRTIAKEIYQYLEIKDITPSNFTLLLDTFVKNNISKNRILTQYSVSLFLKRIGLSTNIENITRMISNYENYFEKSSDIFENADMLFNNESELAETKIYLEKLLNPTQDEILELRQAVSSR
jgi:hypothetical protein